MKKQIILAIALTTFLYAKAQDYDARQPQSIEISTTGISIEDLYSYAKYWLTVQARAADEATRNKFGLGRRFIDGILINNVQTSYITEDFNSKKMYGSLETRFQRQVRHKLFIRTVSFRLILSCEEDKVTLTICCGLADRITDSTMFPTMPEELQPIDGKMEWEELKRNFTDFFSRAIYENK